MAGSIRMWKVRDMLAIKWLVEHFQKEGRVICEAPVAFVVAILILGMLIFVGVEWHDAGTDSVQRATIENLKIQNGVLQEELKGTSPQLAAIQTQRDSIRRSLQEFYVHGAELFNRSISSE
jgi:hypothetical protein